MIFASVLTTSNCITAPNSTARSVNLGTQLGIANANAGGPGLLHLGFNGGNPSGPGTGVLTNVGSDGVQQRFQDAVIQASDAVVLTHNRHVLHMGFEFWRDRINTFYTGNSGALGAIIFNGAFTSSDPTNVTPATGGYGGADFYLGLPSSYGKGISAGQWGQRANIFAGYVQDDWRATQNLTINLGLRYEAHTPWIEAHDQQVNFDLFTGQVLAPNCAKVDLGTAPVTCSKPATAASTTALTAPRDLQPRIGFAWTPSRLGGKTVFRGAFSISSYLEGTGTNLRLPINPPFTQAETLVQYNNVALPGTTTGRGLAPVGAASDPFARSLWSGSGIPNVQPAHHPAVERDRAAPVRQQRTIQVGYVGQHGTHLMVPMPYLQRQLLPNSACGTPPCTAPSVFLLG